MTAPAEEQVDPATAWNTPQIEHALKTRFSAPEFTTLFNVNIHSGSNYVDAMAMSQFRSRGLHLHGFEVKASRSDWVRELKNPTKAEAGFSYCHFWWLVVGHRKIVKEGELPAGWGLLAPSGDSLRQIVKPVQQEPRPLTWQLMASIFRRAGEQGVDTALFKKEYEAGYAAGLLKGQQSTPDAGLANQAKRYLSNYDELRVKVEEFTRTTGIPLSDSEYWPAKLVGEAVRLVLKSGGVEFRIRQLEGIAGSCEQVAKTARRDAAELKRIPEL